MSKKISIVYHKKAKFQYEILETLEAGIVLKGSEVKAIRKKMIRIEESFVQWSLHQGCFLLLNCHIGLSQSNLDFFGHEPDRSRILLLHKIEIRRLIGKTKEKGWTLIPLEIYINERGKVKCLIALAKGKTLHDKRETLKKRDIERAIQKEWKRG